MSISFICRMFLFSGILAIGCATSPCEPLPAPKDPKAPACCDAETAKKVEAELAKDDIGKPAEAAPKPTEEAPKPTP